MKKNELQNEETNEQETSEVEPVNENKEEQSQGYENEHLANIETNRIKFLSFYQKHNILKWVIGLLALGLVLADFLALPNFFPEDKKAIQLVVMLVVAGVVLGGLGTYTILVKKAINKKMKAYFQDYYYESNAYVFDQSNFNEFESCVPDKIEQIQFDENKLFVNVANVGSRGLSTFRYSNKPMMVCDCAAQVREGKAIKPVFVGKYLISDCKYDSNDPIIIYVKGDERSLPPTNVEDIKLVYDEKGVVVYSNNASWNKTINSKILKAIHKIKPHNHLIDVSVSLVDKKIYFCLGYDDPIMVLPLQNPFDAKPLKQYKEDLVMFTSLAEELDKWET